MIYIISAGNSVTGGPESLHQLAYIYKSKGYQVAIYYFSPRSSVTPAAYLKYNVDVVDTIEDSVDNLMIVPEVFSYLLAHYKKIRKCIWWLSSENYFKSKPVYLTKWRMKENKIPAALFPVAFLTLIIKGKIHFDVYNFDDQGKYCHMYNCEYAHQLLIKNGIKEEKTIYLCGPLNDVFFQNVELRADREDIVLFNPKKGAVFTQKVIREAERRGVKATFIPLQNMTAEEIRNVMMRAKLYIDFGNFPGPERIPREAVTLGVNIITGLNGSAANKIDVPIPAKFKFDTLEENIPTILDTICDMIDNYDLYLPCFNDYRTKVREQVELLPVNAERLLKMVGY